MSAIPVLTRREDGLLTFERRWRTISAGGIERDQGGGDGNRLHEFLMKRDLTPEDTEKIKDAILAGDRIEATNIYISITERGLTDAQTFIKALTTEMKSTHGEMSASPLQTRRNIWQRIIFSVRK
ncbi:MAG TPA: hypothetical protein VG733_08180 [Chthoniobacteraceae bacterium]|nr:hypothetical protein [Chthoniobacteraceae bacterium]